MTDKNFDPDMFGVLDSKFQPYIPNIDLISRPRLLGLLNDAMDRKFVLLRSPAGYGKSALLGQWYATLDKQQLYSSWLTLDASEKDEKQFLAYFVLALDWAGAPVDNLVTGARNGFEGRPISQVVGNIVLTMNKLDRKCVLVLEDYHVAECSSVNEIVMRLLREVTSNLCLIIDSRVLPELDVLSLIVSGDAIEIPASQLKLTEQETIELLEDCVDLKDAKKIHDQTEGWLVAVQLAKLQRKTRPDEKIDQLSKGHFVPSYLTKQVLSGLAEKEQAFLLNVSCLKRFNAEITSYISGEDDSFAIINQLKILSPLIVSLDLDGGWYRLHHLIAGYLQDLLFLNDPNRSRHVLLKASQWHSRNGNVVEAVSYAASAQAYDQCHQIIKDAGGWRVILNDGIGMLRAALREIPDDEITKNASSLMARAYLYCKDGEFFEARAALERAWHLETTKDKVLEIDRLVLESIISLYEDRRVETSEYKKLKQTYFDSGQLHALERSTMVVMYVVKAFAEGDLDLAESDLQTAFELMRESGSVLGLNYCYIHAAQIALYRGDMDLVHATVKRALEMAEENYGSDSGLKNLAVLLDYSVMAWLGIIKEDMLADFEQSLSQAMEFEGWTDIYMVCLDAFVMAAIRLSLIHI